MSLSRIPIFIISFNRLNVLKTVIQSYKNYIKTPFEIIIHDNNSSYGPLLSYLKSLELEGVTVFYHDKNISSGVQLNNVALSIEKWFCQNDAPYYVVTDPDIAFEEGCGDILELYADLLESNREIEVVGPMLRIDDIPDYYPLKQKVIERHYQQFWHKTPLNMTWRGKSIQYQHALIDTTFGMYRRGFKFHRLSQGYRIYNPYWARHLDWYLDPKKMSEDQIFYLNSASEVGNWSGTWLREKLHDQGFTLTMNTSHASAIDPYINSRQQLMSPLFSPRYLAHRSFMDLSANPGFHCFWALKKGAEKATAVDIDEKYLETIKETKSRLGLDNLDIEEADIVNWNRSADIVIALKLIHWVYSCAALCCSLDAAIIKLRQLTTYMAIVEWVAPEDPAIESLHNLDSNKEIVKRAYNAEDFKAALSRNFARIEVLGDVSSTRRLYAAFCSEIEIDLSGPLPLLMDKESVIYSRCLSKSNGIEYWSRIYDCDEMIYKQATLDLAKRETYFLTQIECDYFPRVLDSWSDGDYSVLILEKIKGKQLKEAIAEITATADDFHDFIKHGLNILDILKKKGIVHRDIRPDNILIRNKNPILIDFGWAISPDRPYITPPGLGGPERPNAGSFCDVYSMGKVLQQINKQKYHCFDLVIELMAEEDESLRITDLEMLRTLFSSVTQGDKI
jgi:serine/threonine protein kinase